MVPATGTRVFRVEQTMLDSLLASSKSEILYLEERTLTLCITLCGSSTSLVDQAEPAVDLAIFGKTGSGKSVLAKNMVLAYARHTGPAQMGILVIDPQGEFAREFTGAAYTGQSKLNYSDVCKGLKRRIDVVRIPTIRLDRWNLFVDLISRTQFFRRLTIPAGDKIRDDPKSLPRTCRMRK